MVFFSAQRSIANGMGLYEFEDVFPEIRLRHPSESVLASLHAPKLLYLRDLVQRIAVDSGQRVVVFSQWRRFLDLAHWATAPRLEAAGVHALFFSGNESQAQRARNVQRFHDDPNARVLWCTDAGGVGLNLQHAAHVCIHAELPWNPAVFEQRVARIHRMGQPERVTVHTLYSPSTIEGRISETLSTKRQLFQGVFDGDTDTLVFDERGGTLGALNEAYRDEVALALSEQTADGDVDEGEESDASDAENEVDPQTAAGGTPAPTGAAAHPHPDREPNRAPAAEAQPAQASQVASVATLLASLQVTARPDGGLRIDAPPEAAGALAALFRGFAAALEGA
jgi:superfamily II DNA/RNA helicase